MRHAIPTVMFLLSVVAAIQVAAEAPAIAPAKATPDPENAKLLWYDAQLLTIEGQGWTDLKAKYDRLPAKAEEKVRGAVWNLSRHSAGIVVRFATDATQIHARWKVTSSRLAMPHMAATGVSGVDLYVSDEKGRLRWLSCGRPTAQTNTQSLVAGIPDGSRLYQMYLPLYNGVESLEIGIAADKTIRPAEARPASHQQPIVFYGTSITHGACASRPGMVHTAMLGRDFNRPVINLGFSGNGRMETEVAKLLAELAAEIYVIDCLPNINADVVTKNTKPCIDILRAAHPATPIVLVEDRSYADSYLVKGKRERNLTSRVALRKVFDELKASGDDNLYYIEGENLLGDDFDGTVDSSHPNDLGFRRQADEMAKVLRPLLAGRD